MRIALLPYDIIWEDPPSNLKYLTAMMQSADEKPDLWVLPEMFASGFSMNPEKFAEDMNGSSVRWMLEQASLRNAAITGTLAIETEPGRFVNRMLFVRPDGTMNWYDKRHLFAYSGEDRTYEKGDRRVIIEYQGWRILLQICYDLRFPVFSRNKEDYDLILYVANWPSPRAHHWKALLKARAIENQAYVVGVNRTGVDGNGLDYEGESQVYKFDGSKILDSERSSGYFFQDLSLSELRAYREKFPFLKDADDFGIRY